MNLEERVAKLERASASHDVRLRLIYPIVYVVIGGVLVFTLTLVVLRQVKDTRGEPESDFGEVPPGSRSGALDFFTKRSSWTQLTGRCRRACYP